MRAELLDDGGAAAASDDFFRSPEFHVAEGVTHSLVVENRLAIALVVRPVPGDDRLLDASSAYGYPGGVTPGPAEPLDPADVDWSGTGLVSAFVRDSVGGEPCLEGGTLRSEVQLVDPRAQLEIRSTHGRHIRRNARLGYTTDKARGPDSGAAERAAFRDLYHQTMDRTEAAERYYFDEGYFEAVFRSARSWLLLTHAPDGRPAAGAIAVESDALLHYFLGGSADGLLEHSPFKSTVQAMIDLAGELGMPLNLGGGLRSGDALDHFKRGFSNSSAPFYTHELICDPLAYRRLAAGCEDSGYFPLYRAPG